jgi:hypothetical protein
MVVKSEEVLLKLNQLTNRLISREDAQIWSIQYRDACDEGNLLFDPVSEELKIWDALQFIELFAEKISISEYLYSDIDLFNYSESNGWKVKW